MSARPAARRPSRLERFAGAAFVAIGAQLAAAMIAAALLTTTSGISP